MSIPLHLGLAQLSLIFWILLLTLSMLMKTHAIMHMEIKFQCHFLLNAFSFLESQKMIYRWASDIHSVRHTKVDTSVFFFPLFVCLFSTIQHIFYIPPTSKKLCQKCWFKMGKNRKMSKNHPCIFIILGGSMLFLKNPGGVLFFGRVVYCLDLY